MSDEAAVETRPHALPAAAIAAALGLSGDLLLRAMPWGIDVLLWSALVLAGALYLSWRLRPQPSLSFALAAAGVLLFASCYAWRDSWSLLRLDFFLLALSFLLLALDARGVRIWAAGIARSAFGLLLSALLAFPGMFQLLLMDIPWRELRPGRSARRTFVILRGVVIALPMLLIFGLLLSSADQAFSALLKDIFRIDIPRLISHIFLTVFFTFLTAGLLRSMLWSAALSEIDRPSFLHLGAAEVNIAIGLVDALFAAFVAVQFRYFFGGSALVQIKPGLTYADYARHGFFELVWVAALVVPMLLVADWIIDASQARGVRTFRLLALVQVLLVGVMLVSAYQRMQLYVDEYGLTELRVYTTAFMFWLAALLAWFAATVLTGRRVRFVIGALASGAAVVIALHAIDPDDLIVRTNIARAASGKRAFDALYAAALSADADPTLVANIGRLHPCAARQILGRDARNQSDWRSWNLARERAHAAITAKHAELLALSNACAQR